MIPEHRIRNVFNNVKTDKSSTHGYEKIYFDILNRGIDSVLEIGVKRGRSLLAWRQLLPDAVIYGVDNSDSDFKEVFIEPAKVDKLIIKDSTDESIVKDINRRFDLIIDDGNHFYKNQIKTFDIFKYYFNKVYVIEDIYSNLEDVVEHVKKSDFQNYFVYPTNLRNKSIDKQLTIDGTYGRKERVTVNLYSIVIYK